MNAENSTQGLCNIGERELRLRKKLFTISSAIALLAAWLFVFHHQSIFLLMFFFISLFSSILIFIEIKTRFCVLFGIFNLENFGRLGDLHDVTCPEKASKARAKAKRIILNSFFMAAILTGLIYYAVCLNSH
jgi:predicted secreted protein